MCDGHDHGSDAASLTPSGLSPTGVTVYKHGPRPEKLASLVFTELKELLSTVSLLGPDLQKTNQRDKLSFKARIAHSSIL